MEVLMSAAQLFVCLIAPGALMDDRTRLLTGHWELVDNIDGGLPVGM